jgi:hypothetical protein
MRKLFLTGMLIFTINITFSLQITLGQELGYTEYLKVNSIAGKLDSLIETSNYQIRKIAISGSINAKDFRFIKTFLKNIEDIDLSNVNIEEYVGSEGTNEGYSYKYPANEIPLGAFFYWVPVDDGMHSIKNVKLPKTITAIRRNAFARNYNLQSIEIPEGVTTIDYVAFAVDTSLISINFPSTLNSIGSLAFHNCINLDTVVLAAKIPPAIPLDAFEGGGNNRKPYSATLYVPIGTKSLYLNSNWKVFKNIIEKDFSKNIPEYLPKVGLIGWWPFNGNANDESGNGHNGTVNGANLTNDRFGNKSKAYSFNNNDVSVNISNSQFNSDFSISVWVFLDSLNSTTTYPTFITQENSYLTFQCVNYPNGSSPKANFYFLNNYKLPGQQIEDGHVQANLSNNKWMNLILVNSSGINHLYINGTLKATSNSPSTIQGKGAGNFLRFGNGDELPHELFIGKLDDIGIWNKALTEQEITKIFKGDNIPISDCKEMNGSLLNGLVAYYPFCGNANDESGSGLNGQVNGASLTNDRFGNENSAYSFTTNQDITIPNSQNQNLYPLTISLWYNVDSIDYNENGNLFSKYAPAAWNGFIVNTIGGTSDGNIMWPWYVRNQSNKVLGLYGEEAFHQPNYEIHKWYHFVFIVDESGGKIYVNGVLIGSHKWTGTPGACSNALLWKIGGLYNNWFHGKIDDVGLWNRILTTQEILQLYGSTICNTPPPVGNRLQTFNEGQQLFNLSIIGDNIKWYNDSINGSPISEDTFLEDGTIYYASQTQNGCESPNRLAVKVKLSKISASSTTVCSGAIVTLTGISNQTTESYSIGSQGPAGGYVFYDKGFESNGWRYMEAAPNDIVNSSWGCMDVNIAGTGLALGSGFSNTNLIVTGCTNNNIAAKRCLDFSINGYDDWFLPSQNEFTEIYKNLISKNIGNFSTTPIPNLGNLYWTSTQLTTASGSHCNLDNGQFYQFGKVYELYVRPVRYFSNNSSQTYLWSTGEKTASIHISPTQTSTYWLEITSNGKTSRDSITIYVTNTPAPTGILNQSFNAGAMVYNLQATGNCIKWYSAAASNDSLEATSPLIDGLTYFASQTVNGCESQNRLEVKVTITGETDRKISFSDQTVKVGETVEILILTNELFYSDTIISYQFNFNFDPEKLKYIGQSTIGTIGNGGNVLVNSTNSGILKISYMRQNALTGSGAILKLNFDVLSSGSISPTISGFLFNSEIINNISNGIINAVTRFGDIDNNTLVQAYDAALALQYSVGFDPIPQIDPVPWEAWRFLVGNVDGIGDITAYDAALILQYSVGILKSFPVEMGEKAASISDADVLVTIKDNFLYFNTLGNVIGFNLQCSNCNDILGEPIILNNDLISAININRDSYNVGIASINSINENQPFMKIPILKSDTVTFEMVINNEQKTIAISPTITNNFLLDKSMEEFILFPNPANNILNIKFFNNSVQKGYDMKIKDITGRDVYQSKINQPVYQMNVKNRIGKGMFFVHVTNEIGELVGIKKVIIE